MPGTVHFERAEGVATLTLDNPKARNAFDYEMTQQLRRHWGEIARDPEIVCAIVTGAGDRAFCTGWDISSTASGASQHYASTKRQDAPYGQITALQNRCWKPVITAVNGMCVGGGLHFVADGDIVIAAETATFFDTHCEVGLPAALEPAGLARKIPLDAVMRMMLLGSAERMSAARAREIGLIGEVVPAAKLMERARELASIIARYSPTALARTKRATWLSLDHGLEEGLDAAHRELETHFAGHPDTTEGPKAFLEKRKPRWAPYVGEDD
jgi:enoyl-CoA hydratase/carnithine racemase